jgi:hypothetical protein
VTPFKEEKPAAAQIEEEIKNIFLKDEGHNEHRKSKGKARK